MTPGSILSLAFFVALVVSLFQPSDSSRRYGVLALALAFFVLSDLADLLTVGPWPSPIQRALGVSLWSYWIGRMVLFGAFAAVNLVIALKMRRIGK